MSKLHRLLGARVPPELLFPSRIPSAPRFPANLAAVRDVSLRQARRAELRTTPSSWTKRLKDSLIHEKDANHADATPIPIPRGSYLQSQGQPLDPLEKQMAVKRASKMRYVSFLKGNANPSASLDLRLLQNPFPAVGGGPAAFVLPPDGSH